MEDSTKKKSEAGLAEDKRDTPEYWKNWIKAAQEAAKDHWDAGRKAWSEYEKRDVASNLVAEDRPYSIYWSSCKILEPAYYSRTPKILSHRRAGITDPVALTMSLIVERLGEYAVEGCDFDDTMQAAVLDFIHTDKATTQVKFEEVEKRVQVRVPLTPSGDSFLDPTGAVFNGEIQQDEQGFFSMEESTVFVPRVCLMPCSYDEVLHTPDAKCEEEIRAKAYYFFMSKDEAKIRFPGKTINWKTGARVKKGDVIDDKDHPEHIGPYVEGWECYCKDTGKI